MYIFFYDDGTLDQIALDLETADVTKAQLGKDYYTAPSDYDQFKHDIKLVDGELVLTTRDTTTDDKKLKEDNLKAELEYAKYRAISTIRSFRNKIRLEGITYKNIRFSADDVALGRLSAAILASDHYIEESKRLLAEENIHMPDYTVPWFGVQGNFTLMTLADLKLLTFEVGKFIKLTVVLEHYFVTKIHNATTIADVDAIVAAASIPTTWAPAPIGINHDVDITSYITNLSRGDISHPTIITYQ